MKTDYSSNIWKFYLFRAIGQLELTMAIFVLFLLANDLSMTQIMLLETLFIIVVLVFEVPSGAFADMFGRKLSLTLSEVFWILGFVVFGLSTNFWMFALAQALVGIGLAMKSGADSAFLYDSLKAMKREKEYAKFQGRVGFYAMVVYTFSSLVSGFLALHFGYRTLFFVSAAIFSGAFIVSLFFKEPPIHKHVIEKNYFQHLKKAVKFALEHKIIRNLIIYFSMFAALGHLTWLVIQPYYGQKGLPVYIIGVALAVYFITAGLGFLFADFFIKKIKEKPLLYWMMSLSALSFIAIYFVGPYLAFLFIGIMSFLCGVRDVAINKDIHKHTESHRRATVISIKSMSKAIMYAIFAPLIGYFMDVYSAGATFLMMGIGLMIFFVYILFLFRTHKTKNI